MLEKGKADYLLEYKRFAEAYLKGRRIQNLRFRAFTVIDLYFVISKKTSGAEKVLLCMEDAYKQLKEEGKLNFDCKYWLSFLSWDSNMPLFVNS